MHRFSKGFTIIETMLFLAITGLLVMAILIGASGSINRQRYQDSVVSLHSFMQNQYSEVMNVQNSRDSKWTCSSDNVVTPVASGGISRGQTDCLILGNLITSSGTDKLTVRRVVGRIPLPDNTADFSPENVFIKQKDITVGGTTVTINGYNASMISSSQQTYNIDWGGKMMNLDGEDFNFSIMIVRSPVTGLINTFIQKTVAIGNSAELQQYLGDGSLSSTNIKICVNPTGMFAGTPNAIQIKKGAVNASGVESLGDGESGCKKHV